MAAPPQLQSAVPSAAAKPTITRTPSSGSEDASISIPYKSICDSFICPICLEEITDAHMTHCGHNACENCIREALNRRHHCPVCNTATTPQQLVKNHAFDSLFQRAKAAKEAASRGYIESLMKRARIGASPATVSSSVPENKDATHASPIEAVFQKHIRRSLLMYEDYYTELKIGFEKQRAILTADFQSQLETLEAKRHVADEQKETLIPGGLAVPTLSRGLSSEQQPARAIEILREKHDIELKELTRRFDKSVSLLVTAYDVYMGSITPSPFLLPVKATIIAVDRTPQIRCDVALRSTDTMSDIRKILKDKSIEMGSTIIEYGADVKIWTQRPSATAAGADVKTVTTGGATLVTDERLTVAELKLEQSCLILVSGSVRLKSEQAPKCFTALYVQGGEQRVDYFKCADCDCNWICKACAQHCHTGHRLTTFFNAHKPSYACCYCVKKRTCKLENNKSPTYRPPTEIVHP